MSNPVHNIQNYISSKLLTRLTLVLSHLIEHRFDHSFQNCISPLCNCSLEVESTAHFFLHCHYYHNISPTRSKDTNLLKLSEEQLTKALLYGFSQCDQNQNRDILISSMDYIIESKRFESSLF